MPLSPSVSSKAELPRLHSNSLFFLIIIASNLRVVVWQGPIIRTFVSEVSAKVVATGFEELVCFYRCRADFLTDC